MIYLLNNRLIHIEWSIFKGTSQVREDFSRSLVKVFLIGPDEKYLLNATAQNGTLAMDVPQGLPEGAYSIECIYVKNYESLLPVRGTLTPSGEPVCHRFPWGHPHNPHFIHPHDHRSNDRCLMRSRMDYVFALTSVHSEADGVSSDGEATLRFKSSVASYGYDGLSAYEIAVMRGDFNGSEGEWLEWMTPKEIEIDDALSETSGNPVENRVMTREFNKKQNSLVSGKNIKTLNGQSLLGEGNISITGEGTAITVENEFGQSTENPGSQKLITQVNESVGKANENITKISNSLTETNESIKTVSDSVNAIADDEDLVLVESEDEEEEITKKLKFADKAYNASSFSGMGRAYLRKNITGGKNILTQAMMGKANTRYVIQYDYDLNGETVTVPEGCTLDFQGGSLRNGILIGDNTTIISNLYKIFDLTMSFNGYFNISGWYPEWFGASGNGINDDTRYLRFCWDLTSSLPDTQKKILLPKSYAIKTLVLSKENVNTYDEIWVTFDGLNTGRLVSIDEKSDIIKLGDDLNLIPTGHKVRLKNIFIEANGNIKCVVNANTKVTSGSLKWGHNTIVDFSNVTIRGFKGTGIDMGSITDSYFNDVLLEASGGTLSTGIKVYRSQILFYNLVIRYCNIGIECSDFSECGFSMIGGSIGNCVDTFIKLKSVYYYCAISFIGVHLAEQAYHCDIVNGPYDGFVYSFSFINCLFTRISKSDTDKYLINFTTPGYFTISNCMIFSPNKGETEIWTYTNSYLYIYGSHQHFKIKDLSHVLNKNNYNYYMQLSLIKENTTYKITNKYIYGGKNMLVNNITCNSQLDGYEIRVQLIINGNIYVPVSTLINLFNSSIDLDGGNLFNLKKGDTIQFVVYTINPPQEVNEEIPIQMYLNGIYL